MHFRSCYITLIPQLCHKFLAHIYIQATNNDLYLNVGYYIHIIEMCYFYLVMSLAILVGCMHEHACMSACMSVWMCGCMGVCARTSEGVRGLWLGGQAGKRG